MVADRGSQCSERGHVVDMSNTCAHMQSWGDGDFTGKARETETQTQDFAPDFSEGGFNLFVVRCLVRCDIVLFGGVMFRVICFLVELFCSLAALLLYRCVV